MKLYQWVIVICIGSAVDTATGALFVSWFGFPQSRGVWVLFAAVCAFVALIPCVYVTLQFIRKP